ncbi:DUF3784 domain-containing protein [Irregularibacter muris]|uniref:DUF3784 domain-containing protein n=1 Tax=Irregularibacter muris TaxID=1796619 RepID=A0AAE3HF08_9FIRM|nr:DUF3784 domain-containing protein [Irregularibacter muris]MCR1898239.1 DUF3784 domain-containing protein [Irregularibacter muris]
MGILYSIAGLFFFLALGIKYLKWDFLIAGYNTMGKEQKKNVNIQGLRRAMGNFLLIMALFMIISAITSHYGYRGLSSISLLAILPLAVLFVFHSQKYDHSKKTTSKTIEKRFILGIVIFVLGIVSILFIYAMKDPQIEMNQKDLTIGGMYSNYVKKENIKEITLQEEIPKIMGKVGGFDLGYILRGSFTLENKEEVNLSIYENKPPYIVIITKSGKIIVNYRQREETLKVYQELKDWVKD